MHPRSSLAEKSSQLVRDGYTCLQGLYPPPEIAQARQRVLEHIQLLRNTRPNPSSGHLAGFHRYPELEPLHTLLSCQADILGVLISVIPFIALFMLGRFLWIRHKEKQQAQTSNRY